MHEVAAINSVQQLCLKQVLKQMLEFYGLPVNADSAEPLGGKQKRNVAVGDEAIGTPVATMLDHRLIQGRSYRPDLVNLWMREELIVNAYIGA